VQVPWLCMNESDEPGVSESHRRVRTLHFF
jgi:hypothetical protein